MMRHIGEKRDGPGSPNILICCSEMLCDLTGVNDAFEHGFYWEDNDGKPLSLHEWLSDKEGDIREIKRCQYCGRVPLKRREASASRALLQHRPGDDPQARIGQARQRENA